MPRGACWPGVTTARAAWRARDAGFHVQTFFIEWHGHAGHNAKPQGLALGGKARILDPTALTLAVGLMYNYNRLAVSFRNVPENVTAKRAA